MVETPAGCKQMICAINFSIQPDKTSHCIVVVVQSMAYSIDIDIGKACCESCGVDNYYFVDYNTVIMSKINNY